MKQYTVQDIVDLNPCRDYPRERIEDLWSGRESLSLLEIFDLDIPPAHRFWVCCEVLPDGILRRLARIYSLRIVHLWECPDICWWYLTTGETAACDAARDAAWAEAWAAARAEAWEWQLEQVRAVLVLGVRHD